MVRPGNDMEKSLARFFWTGSLLVVPKVLLAQSRSRSSVLYAIVYCLLREGLKRGKESKPLAFLQRISSGRTACFVSFDYQDYIYSSTAKNRQKTFEGYEALEVGCVT